MLDLGAGRSSVYRRLTHGDDDDEMKGSCRSCKDSRRWARGRDPNRRHVNNQGF